MKHTILILLTCLFTYSECIGQDGGKQITLSHQKQELLYGLKMGASYSGIVGQGLGSSQYTYRLGIVSGAFISIPLVNNWGLQPELLFSQTGFRYKGILNGEAYDIIRTSSYFQLPLYIVYKPCAAVSLLIGPQCSVLIQEDDKSKLISGVLVPENSKAHSETGKLMPSISGGIDFNTRWIVIGGRGGINLLNCVPGGGIITNQYKNLWTQVTIGYKFSM